VRLSRAADRRSGRPRRGRDQDRPTEGAPRVALGVTGGIAAYKAAEVVRGLVKARAEVHVLMTSHACQFITPLTLQTLSGRRVLTDPWDLSHGADIQHITLARDLDLLLVAPATASILARMAHGIADDLLSTFYLAVTAPVVVAPAMNVWMWEHAATRANVDLLKGRGVHVLDPGVGDLACGEEGIGRIAEPGAIVDAVLALLKKKAPVRLKAAAFS
jgi:phosphopantothenoylcysteine decarboxylase / phosphopantothenate---cysteine ligase